MPMRVVIDANVAIAGVAARGLCEAVMELCLERHQVILCPEILRDIHEKLIAKIKVPANVAADYLKLLRATAEVIEPEPVPDGICRDPDDRAVLGLIVPARAEIVVSGDKDLLVLGEYKGVRIVAPREFWEASRKAGT